ncbi:MAG: OmpA family protein [Lachnospira sp.]
MAKKRGEDAPPAALWKDTFSDLMNLLLCFFVLLFSMSTVDAEKFEQIAASLSSSFSILPSGGSAIMDEGILISSGASQLNDLSVQYNDMGLNTEGEFTEEIKSAQEQVEAEGLEESSEMAEEIEQVLKNENISDQVEITAYSKYVVLNLNGGVLFESGSAELTEDAIKLLDKVGDAIKVYDDNVITIEGHTDNVPINTAKYPNNMMLSLHRAYSVYDYLVKVKGFDDKTMTSSGRGESVPIATNETAEGRSQNRRVEIKIYNDINS